MNREHPVTIQRIVQDPEIMVGKPVIKGTRIPVERVLAHLAHNPDPCDLLATYPELTTGDIKTCLAYAREAVARTGAKARRDFLSHLAHT